ncbi:hypothetical protein B0I37DRAFT_357812 [Chaetomium sp. MPI-CAGE-AT-0009]|nr:hypothetical protein B0I37DRAFT_357812 [Chaetomium sp. MPI-CAGE-AT-0009]
MATAKPGLAGTEMDVVSILERVSSVLSMLGCMVVITTFTFSRAFHKPINRLVFYASFGNLLTNVGTLIGRSFVNDINGVGCRTQAFLIQTFMPADALWMLAMALNVHLTFYFKFDARQLRRMELPYFVLCYGIPFIVSLVMVFVSSPDKGPMIGNATLWCWISPKWDIFRIALFYGPIWIVMLITCSIYIRAGREIYKKHQQLKQFSFSTSHHDPDPAHAVEDLFSSTKTTEVYVTTEVIDKQDHIDLTRLGRGERRQSQGSSPQRPPKAAYSVTISSHRHGDNSADGEQQQQQQQQQHRVQTTITADPQASGPGLTRVTTNTHNNDNNNNDNPLTQTTTNTAHHPSQNPTQTQTSGNQNPLRRRAAYEATNATWSYTKCALLFFTAMLVTWIPSSSNRLYSFVNAGKTSIPLEYMSSFVLPLQGFWNAIIYCVTSWGACRMLMEDLGSWWFGVMGSVRKGSDSKTYETESMTELAASRPGSSGSPAMPTPLPPPQTAKMGV